jgi:hypothetical protein
MGINSLRDSQAWGEVERRGRPEEGAQLHPSTCPLLGLPGTESIPSSQSQLWDSEGRQGLSSPSQGQKMPPFPQPPQIT